jgi:hypothetical protein
MRWTYEMRFGHEAARLAGELGMESSHRLHGDLCYHDPMLVGKYLGVDVLPFEFGGPAQVTHRSRLLAP